MEGSSSTTEHWVPTPRCSVQVLPPLLPLSRNPVIPISAITERLPWPVHDGCTGRVAYSSTVRMPRTQEDALAEGPSTPLGWGDRGRREQASLARKDELRPGPHRLILELPRWEAR